MEWKSGAASTLQIWVNISFVCLLENNFGDDFQSQGAEIVFTWTKERQIFTHCTSIIVQETTTKNMQYPCYTNQFIHRNALPKNLGRLWLAYIMFQLQCDGRSPYFDDTHWNGLFLLRMWLQKSTIFLATPKSWSGPWLLDYYITH